jgi:hypothetical protein
VDWSGLDAEAAKAVGLIIVALLLPLGTTLWLRDTWRRLQGSWPPDEEAW